MVSFRKLILVTGLLAVFAGMALAATTTVPVINAVPTVQPTVYNSQILRSEGTTELLPPVLYNFLTLWTPPAGAGPTANYNITIYSAAPVTSAKNEIKLTMSDGGVFTGTAAGSSIQFTAVAITPATTGMTLSGVRIDATKLPSLASGSSTGVGENMLVVMQALDPFTNASPFGTTPYTGPGTGGTSPVNNLIGVAFAVPTLSAKETGGASYLQCDPTPYDPTSTEPSLSSAFEVQVTELYSTAFKVAANEGGAEVTQATQISISFANVPANVALYVPNSVNNFAGFALKLVSPTTGAAKDGTETLATGGAVYEVTAETTGLDIGSIPVYVAWSGGVPALTTAKIAATVAYAPTAAGKIPSFAGVPITDSSASVSITACTTNLLFTYLTNAAGWANGIAVSNTSTLGGVCNFTFYGTAGTPAKAVVFGAAGFGDSTVIAAQTTAVDMLSNSGVTAAYISGYANAVCNFLGGHGYTFVIGTNQKGAFSNGYLAIVNAKKAGF